MKHVIPVLTLLLLLSGVFLTEAANPDQPHMRAALELLQSAKKSDQPLPMLTSARKHLKNASKNKGGARVEALELVNEAIAQAQVGDKKKTEQKINAAIANIHSGIGNAK
ncbi:hypothetical protein DES53_110168 [Roseimicrobium gellanilyticum]|uniref:Small metal-binding protein n=1 Tax=Roseimicrobium gellanilyticum TaxID=748857 RepID=A0A366HBX4_9BACT|nr:hypothetical protein [Roseimicrobium gellanilyticum]RBP39144.1 hypothetical protein DES53_110168 [Roseimicrobium gellanilyticum]